MKRRSPVRLVLISALLACGEDAGGPSQQQSQEQEIAARQACIAERLAQRAEEELQTLQELSLMAGPVGFQRAYTQHANLRHAAFAHYDSALNHARTPADSARHESAVAGFQIRAPEPESVEANVIRSYEANFAAIFNDADHPCNWESELESAD